MVKMAKNRKKWAVLFITIVQISVGVFCLTSRAGWYWGGGGTTVVGEKPPTSPYVGSGWHATLIRVNRPSKKWI